MNILFISPYPPSPIRTRTEHFILGLAKRGHTIHLLYLRLHPQELDASDELRKNGVIAERFDVSKFSSYCRCALNLLSDTSLMSSYCSSEPLKNRVKELISTNAFDIVHVEHVRTTQFIPKGIQIPVIFDAVDCMSAQYREFYNAPSSLSQKVLHFIEFQKLKRYEPQQLSRFQFVAVTTQADRDLLRHLGYDGTLRVIDNGVDAAYFSPRKIRQSSDLIFTGKMSYFANEHAALYLTRQIMPIVWKKFPQLSLCIAGNSPSCQIRALGKDAQITVTGFVNDMRVPLSQAKISVCPLFVGTGIKNKILEAMAMGKPVITTQKALGSLRARRGEEILIAENAEEFATLIVKLLGNEKLRKTLGAKARKYARKFHRWSNRIKTLEAFYREAIRAS